MMFPQSSLTLTSIVIQLWFDSVPSHLIHRSLQTIHVTYANSHHHRCVYQQPILSSDPTSKTVPPRHLHRRLEYLFHRHKWRYHYGDDFQTLLVSKYEETPHVLSRVTMHTVSEVHPAMVLIIPLPVMKHLHDN